MAYSRLIYVIHDLEFSEDMKTLIRCPENYVGSFIIPDGVENIGDKAFYDCKLITSIHIPNSVKRIGKEVFDGCCSLASISLNNVESIGDYAFKSCTRIEKIHIPSCVKEIGINIFCGCTNLNHVTIDSNNINFDSRNHCNAVINTATNTLIVGCKATTIPKSVSSIGNFAFESCNGLSSLEIPNGVTSIGNFAFAWCISLKKIAISNSIVSIGNHAFEYCNSLNEIIIPNSVLIIGDSAFSSCSGLKSLIIPQSVKTIGNCAFSWCSNIISITISNGVRTIGECAFARCTKLKTISFPSSIKYLGKNVFDNCTHLDEIIVPNGQIDYFSQLEALNDYDEIIYELDDLDENTCLNTVGFNDPQILHRCSIDFHGKYIVPNNIKTISNEAFLNCKGLLSITIPDSVTKIGDRTFVECSNLSKVSLPNSIENIGYCTFMWCSSLKTLTIPIGVRSIGDYAFAGCQNLVSIILPSTTIKIGSQAFTGCQNLKEIIVPKGRKAFFAQMDTLAEYSDIIIDKGEDELLNLFETAKKYEQGATTKKNITEALKIYKQAANKGCFEALYHLGELYLKGENVLQDLSIALESFEKLAEYEYLDARERVEEIYNLIEENKKIEKQKRIEEQKRNEARSEREMKLIEVLSKNNIRYFYHFTSIRNLDSIKKLGGLYSWYYLKTNNKDIPFMGGNELSHSLDKLKNIADYVHLSFCCDHPMSYRIKEEGEEVAILKISTDVALLKDTIFSNMNAVDATAIVKGGLDGLKRVNFDAVKEQYVSHDDPIFKYHQAEVLVKTHIPLKYILDLDNYLD